MKTGDGSFTIHLPALNEQYHSKHGALQEALHVFIAMGLQAFMEIPLSRKRNYHQQPLQITEYGLGTGLNALLTYKYAKELPIEYTGIEAFPISQEEVRAMDYGSLLEVPTIYLGIHAAPSGKEMFLSENFQLLKVEEKFESYTAPHSADIVYYDAFGPRTQPELWMPEIFQNTYEVLKPGGFLVTYCAQGQARRNMQSAGFTVERLPGPPGKREMLRATKPSV
ncbi:MAG: tRNA (5-methylaminomethyl-2-thiouridine)(34)-methyltransferase MnmD [Nonlabens sp.]